MLCVLAACSELHDFFTSCRDGNVRLMKIGITDGLCTDYLQHKTVTECLIMVFTMKCYKYNYFYI